MNDVASVIAIDNETILMELEDLDPSFSLINLLKIYRKLPDFSLEKILAVVSEKERIMNESPNVIAIYNIIGPSFTVSYYDEAPHTHGIDNYYLISIGLEESADIFDKHNRLAAFFPEADMESEYINGTLVTFGTHDPDLHHDKIYYDLVAWDRIVNGGHLLNLPVDTQYISLYQPIRE